MLYLRLFFLFVACVLVAILSFFCSIFVAFPHPIFVKTKKWLYFLFYKVLGGKVKLSGTICPDKPTLFVANHVSFLDILVLGYILPNASFVSKSAVGKWPIVGTLAKMHGTIFVQRARSSVKGELNIIQKALKEKKRLILFPEGTSYDGTHIKPINSSFFHCQDISPVTIQPLTISYTHLHGIPMGRFGRWLYGWFGDIGLLPHIRHIVSNAPFSATILFHPSFQVEGLCRKSIAKYCEEILTTGIEKTINRESVVTLPKNSQDILPINNI